MGSSLLGIQFLGVSQSHGGRSYIAEVEEALMLESFPKTFP